MAGKIDCPPLNSPISKDVLGVDNPIPLSPQWLLPKPGENKTANATAENHASEYQEHGVHVDVKPSSQNGEEATETHKKKDVFRPSVFAAGSGYRDRWRDEERDTNAAGRRDRWKEADKELGDSRKVDRWVDNPSLKHFGEARRNLSERWGDTSNKETNYDHRRESKWNPRWGPGDKGTDSLTEKWSDSSKETDMSHDKGLSHVTPRIDDEKDGNHYRPWRSSIQNRGRIEHPPQTLTQNKQGTTTYSRAHGDNASSAFSHGGGRVGSGGSTMNNSALYPHGTMLGKAELGEGDPSLVRYSRTELLDVYRITDMKYWHKLLEGVISIPSLTQEDPLGPLAFCTPTSDELAILKGIDNGDILSSGAPQISKDGSLGRNSNDPVQAKQVKFGSREDLSLPSDDNKGDIVDSTNAFREDDSRYNEVGGSFGRGASVRPSTMWRSPSIGEHSNSISNDRVENPADIRSRISDIGWSHAQKDLSNEWTGGLADSSHSKEQMKWHVNDDPIIRRQASSMLDREHESRRLSQTSLEDLILYYKDPQGEIQGPFTGGDIIGWFELGYFGIDLLVRLANAPPDSPFLLLGDVMPHLRAKARPPPGFSAPKQNEAIDIQGRLNLGNYEQPHASAIDIMKNEQRYRHGTATEAENRFLESLMSGNMSSSSQKFAFPPEGMQGYSATSTSGMQSLGLEVGDDPYLLAKRMNFERQKSLPNSNPYWPGREAPSLPHNSDLNPDTMNPHAKNMSSITDHSRLHPISQNLQGLGDRAATSINNGVSSWSTLPVQTGLDPIQNTLDLHHTQNFPPQTAFGIQQQRLQLQNQPSLTSLLAPSIDNPSALMNAENLLSSGIAQDPQMLNLLLQLHSQPPVASQQISLLDKLLLLKQQQKHEEQQQLIRQQQQLLSQILADRVNQHYTEPQPYGQLQVSAPSDGNVPLDHLRFQNPQFGSQLPVANSEEPSNFVGGVDYNVPQQINLSVSSGSLMHLPHQLFENTVPEKNWGSALHNDIPQKELSLNSSVADVINKSSYELSSQNSSFIGESAIPGTSEVFAPVENFEKSVGGLGYMDDNDDETLIADSVNELVVPPIVASEETQFAEEQLNDVSFSINELKISEASDAKKASEKKSRKQKSSKAQNSSNQTKGISKATVQQSKLLDSDAVSSVAIENNSQGTTGENLEAKSDQEQLQSDVQNNVQQQSVSRAWRPAPGFRPKSLLEIQEEEEQRKAQMSIDTLDASTSVTSLAFSTPWAGIFANKDLKTDGVSTDIHLDKGISENKKGRKSQLHDLLVGVGDNEAAHNPSLPAIPIQSDIVDDGDFIEAKDTKRNRKKSKARTGTKGSVSTAPADVSIGSSLSDRTKTTRQTELEKEVLPAVPSGHSLGDFVPWKGDSASTCPAPAWSTDGGKLPMPTSLRDILKEQEKQGSSSAQHQMPILTPQKSLPAQINRGTGSSWSVSATSPAKAASPIQTISRSPAKSKHKGDDDLFWGPVDQAKQETKHVDFPQLASQDSFGTKSVSGKGVSSGVSLSRQKSATNRPSDSRLSSSPSFAPSLKGKTDTASKYSEAMDFRDWCEKESIRLLGSKDTSFLEFCLKQSRSEAKMFLVENLGSFDRDHKFIDRFLDYMELLPADVLEIAFQSQNNSNRKSDVHSGSAGGNGDFDSVGGIVDGSNSKGGGGKKKGGKKGKKVNPSVLGFNVVSNRIMMGEIQNVED